MTRDQAKLLLGVLVSHWPKAELPPQTLRLYQAHLLEFDHQPAARAVVDLGATARYFPTVAELREAVVATCDPDPIPDVDMAWAEVAAAARNGIYGRPVWSHPVVADVVKAMGGIRELAVSDNLMADRAHFLKLYATCKGRAERAKLLPSGEIGELLGALGAHFDLENADRRPALPSPDGDQP